MRIGQQQSNLDNRKEQTNQLLEQLGFSTIQQYCLSYEDNLQQVISVNRISQKQLQEIQYKISNEYSNCQLQNGKDLLKKQQQLGKISFGVIELDNLLEGGLQVGKIYELIGQPCSGKSILAQKLIAQNFLNNKKGAWYLDIQNQFSMKRFLNMYGLSSQKKEFERVFYHQQVQDSKSLYMALCILMSQLSQNKFYNKNKVNLLVIDNLGVILRNKDPFNEFVSYMTQIVNIMKQICSQFNFTILVITNQEEKVIFKSKTEDIYRTKSILAPIWNFAPYCTIFIDNQLLQSSINYQRSAIITYTIQSDNNMSDNTTAVVKRDY